MPVVPPFNLVQKFLWTVFTEEEEAGLQFMERLRNVYVRLVNIP